MKSLCLKTTVCIILCVLCSAAWAAELVIQVHSQGTPLQGPWPITSGVPFKQGDLADPNSVRLLGPDGKEVPVQAQQTARWPDGSVKWLLLDFDAVLSARPTPYRLQYGEGTKGVPFPSPVTVREDDAGFIVTNGPLKLTFRKKGFRLADRIEWQGKEVFPIGPDTGFYMVDDGGKRYDFGRDANAETVIEERGPRRVVVKSEGWNVAPDGAKLGRNVVRMHIWSGKPFIKIVHTFIITADSNVVRYRDIGLKLPFRAERYALPGAAEQERKAGEDPGFLLQWQHDRFEVTAQGRKVGEGKRAPGIVTAWAGDTAMTATMRDFWQNFPKEIEVRPDALLLHLYPAHNKPRERVGEKLTAANVVFHPWAHEGEALDFAMPQEVVDRFRAEDGGVMIGRFSNAMGLARTHEFLLHFHAPVERTHAENAGRTFQASPVPVPDPARMCASGAFGRIAPAGVGPYALVEEGLMHQLDWTVEMREKTGDYGMFNYGDYHYNWNAVEQRWSHNRHYAGWHHGGGRVPWLLFARTGEPRCLEFGFDNARHMTDVDMCHHVAPDWGETTRALAARVKKEGIAAYVKDPTEKETAEFPKEVEGFLNESVHKRVGGLCKYIGFTHWYGGGRAFYNSQADFMLYGYYLTGDRRLWDCAMEFGDALLGITNSTFDGRSGAGRGCTAVDLYQATGEEKYLEYARRQVERSLGKGGDSTPDSVKNHYLMNFYYAPFADRWYEMTQDKELARRWPLWAECVMNNTGYIGDYRRDVHYEKLAYGYLLAGRKEFLEHGLDLIRFYVDDKRLGRPGEWDGNSGLQNVPGYTIQQWGTLLYALQEHQRRTGEWIPLPARAESDRIRFVTRFYKGVPLTVYVRKERDEEVVFAIPGSSGTNVAVVITGPEGKVLWTKPLGQELKEDRPPVEKGYITLKPGDPAGDYRVDVHGPDALLTQWVPMFGKYRKMVFSMPLDLQRNARMYFLPLPASGRAPSFNFTGTGRSAFQFFRLESADGVQQAFASSDGDVLRMTHRPDPALVGKEPWFFFPGGRSGTVVMASGDILPFVSFKREHFFVPKDWQAPSGTDGGILWRLDEGARQLAAVAGRGRDAAVLGASDQPDASDPEWIADGLSGQALRFSGKQYVRYPCVGKAAYRMAGLGELTAEAWVRLPPQTRAVGVVMSLFGSFTLMAGHDRLEASVAPAPESPEHKPVSAALTGRATLGDGAWHHVALSYDGARLRLFADGKCVAQDDKVKGYLDFSNVKGLFLIGAPQAGKPGFVGDIDEVRVSHWCRYVADFTPQPTPK